MSRFRRSVTVWHDSGAFPRVLIAKHMLSDNHIQAESCFVEDRRLRFKLTMPKKQLSIPTLSIWAGWAERHAGEKLTAVRRHEIAKKRQKRDGRNTGKAILRDDTDVLRWPRIIGARKTAILRNESNKSFVIKVVPTSCNPNCTPPLILWLGLNRAIE